MCVLRRMKCLIMISMVKICCFAQTMEVLREGEELVFLYQLIPGKSDTSYACHIAASVGLPKELVTRAAEVRVYVTQT